MTRTLLILFVSILSPAVAMDLVVAPLFQHGAVLQRDREVPIWGMAEPGAKVTITFAGSQTETTAAADGRWMTHLPAMPANAEPQVMTVSSSGRTFMVNDVLVGEVWLASGQSNMGWKIQQSRKEDQAMAQQHPIPGLRIFTVPQRVSHDPQFSVDGQWQHATPQTVSNLSATSYFFGRNLVESLGMPVGIIHSSWGGSRIEPWWDESGLDGIDALAGIRAKRNPRASGTDAYQSKLRKHALAMGEWSERAVAAIDAGKVAPPAPEAPPRLSLGHQAETGTYQAMIHPLAPYAIRGFIWYQGESNRADGALYTAKKAALIDGWRKRFLVPGAPFLFVQLAPFQYGDTRPEELPEFWVSQQKTLEIPNTGMAVTLDIGDVKDIHPGNKSEVGRRLALWALADTYGMSDLVKSGPLYRSHHIHGDTVRIDFDHTGGGLKTRDDMPPGHFEIAGEDGAFKPASAEITRDGKSIILRNADIIKPQQARFAWHKTAVPNLMNQERLPAAAFHTHWPK